MSKLNGAVSNTRWDEDELLRTRREEVLTQWPTDLGSLEDGIARQTQLVPAQRAADVLRDARATGRMAVQPRHGETLLSGQISAMRRLQGAGADILSVLTDAYTRQMEFKHAETALVESEEVGRSLICGYPVVSAGVAATSQLVDSVRRPCSVRMASQDSRLCKEIYLASGFTYMFMGPVQNLAYEKKASPELLIRNYQYEDRIVGYYEAHGAPIVKELPATLTGTLVPPCIAVTSTLIDAMLAIEQGVTRLVVNYGLLGNLLQDVATIRVLREMVESRLRPLGDDLEIYVTTPQWMGDFPHDEAEAYSVILTGALASCLGGADEVVTKSLDEAFGVPTVDANVAGVQVTRRLLDALKGQTMPESDELAAEMDDIRTSVDAILARTFELGGGDLAVGTAAAIRAGVIDVPFSPSLFSAGKAMPIRDLTGAVRWLNPGELPLPDSVRAYHESRVQERLRASANSSPFSLVVSDITEFSKGLSVHRPQLPDGVPLP